MNMLLLKNPNDNRINIRLDHLADFVRDRIGSGSIPQFERLQSIVQIKPEVFRAGPLFDL